MKEKIKTIVFVSAVTFATAKVMDMAFNVIGHMFCKVAVPDDLNDRFEHIKEAIEE